MYIDAPKIVPEIVNGFYWDPARISGIGSSHCIMPEMNGKSAADQIQPTNSKQPALIVNNGNIQMQVSDASTDGRLLSAGPVKAGWSGATYVAMWHKLPNGTPVVGSTILFVHNLVGTGTRRMTIINNGTIEQYQINLSQDGTSVQSNAWNVADYDWHYIEFIYTPGHCAFCVDLIEQAPAIEGINCTSLNDPEVSIAVCSSVGAGINQNVQQCGVVYYGNGVPSYAHRQLLMNHKRPA